MKLRKHTRTVMMAAVTAFSMVLSGCGSKGSPDQKSPSEAQTTAAPLAMETKEDGSRDMNSGYSKDKEGGSEVTGIQSLEDKLVVGIKSDPGTCNPYRGSIGNVVRVCYSYLEALTTYDAEGALTNLLAESIDYDEDSMGCTVKVHEGVTFHNGDKLTADDIIFTFGTACRESATTTGYMAHVDLEHIEKIDDYTVHFNFLEPYGTFGYAAANIYIVNHNTYEEEAAGGEYISGTGAFQIKEWVAGTSVECERFDDYWRGKPYIQTVLYRIIPESSVRMVELENGAIDMYQGAEDSDIKRVMNGESTGVSLWKAPASMNHHYLGFNVSHAPFDDVRVRQALCYALDLGNIVDVAWGVSAIPNQSLLPADMWYSYEPSAEQTYEFNPEKAKELLAEAGYPDGLTIRLKIDNNVQRHTIAEMLPSMLSASGISIEVTPMEKAAYSEWRTTAKDDYDLFLANFGNLFEPSSTISTSMLSKNQEGGQGLWNYQGMEYGESIDKWLTEAASEPDLEARSAKYKELQSYYMDNCLGIGICDYFDCYLIDEHLKNFNYCPPIDFAFAYFE